MMAKWDASRGSLRHLSHGREQPHHGETRNPRTTPSNMTVAHETAYAITRSGTNAY